MEKIITWIKANIMLAVIALVAVVFLFGKQLKKLLFGTTRRRRRRRPLYKTASVTRRRTRRTAPRKALPRSVGTRRGNGYPAAGGGTIPYKYNKDGTIKKAWQVGGTLAAKQRMSRLRRNK